LGLLFIVDLQFLRRVPCNNYLQGVLPAFISAPASTENFLNGMANFNTDLVWNALSPELQERLNTNGNDKETLRKTMAEARQEPTRVVSINYIGGYRLPDQTTYYFYVVGNDKGKQVDYSFYVFTVNAEGTILQVE
jgi:hypothetical protein